MSQEKPQSFSNHARFDPWFHGVGGVAIVVSLGVLITFLVLHLRTEPLLSLWIVTAYVIFTIALFKSRTYTLKVQDRVIRLEERMRLDALLPDALRRRIPELTEDQLVGLRFASDDELPKLVEMTLDKGLNRKQIKERIQNWRPDHWRV
jgi:Family of unknown function (DUF6526)